MVIKTFYLAIQNYSKGDGISIDGLETMSSAYEQAKVRVRTKFDKKTPTNC